jgi:hypothetical protein
VAPWWGYPRVFATKQQIIRVNWKHLMGVMTVAGAVLGSAYGAGTTKNYDYASGLANGGNIPD